MIKRTKPTRKDALKAIQHRDLYGIDITSFCNQWHIRYAPLKMMIREIEEEV